MAIAQNFTNKVNAGVKGNLPSYEQFSKNGIPTRADGLRAIGRRYLRIDDIKIWGNPISSASISNSTSIVPAQPRAGVCELTDNTINSASNLGLVVIGYGDPSGSYGAGPTRDLRRATLAVRASITFREVELCKKISGATVHSDFVKEIAGILARDFSGNAGEKVKMSSMDKGFWLDFGVNSVFKVGRWPFSAAKGNVAFTLTFGYQSGQNFLPVEIRGTSPFFGRLDHIYAGVGSSFEQAKIWMEGEAAMLQKVAERLSAAKHKPDVVVAVTIDNT